MVGVLLLALAVAAVPLSRLAHQSLNASGGSVPVWIAAAYGAVGVIIAWRKPGNPLGWAFLLGGFFSALSEDASFYMVADYRVRHGSLPALFSPLRRRIQHAVDRRFNRARYDAESTVAAFTARLQDAVDLDSVSDDLAGAVRAALEPAHVSVWIAGTEE
jgi:hypothetical protein